MLQTQDRVRAHVVPHQRLPPTTRPRTAGTYPRAREIPFVEGGFRVQTGGEGRLLHLHLHWRCERSITRFFSWPRESASKTSSRLWVLYCTKMLETQPLSVLVLRIMPFGTAAEQCRAGVFFTTGEVKPPPSGSGLPVRFDRKRVKIGQIQISNYRRQFNRFPPVSRPV